MHTSLQVLRAKIRGLQAAGVSIHNRIRKAKGPKRNRLWNEKRCLGGYNREHLIAYGLLRGIPYTRIEKCSENNRPNPQKVFELVQAHGAWRARQLFTIEKVKELLTPGSTASTPKQEASFVPGGHKELSKKNQTGAPERSPEKGAAP